MRESGGSFGFGLLVGEQPRSWRKSEELLRIAASGKRQGWVQSSASGPTVSPPGQSRRTPPCQLPQNARAIFPDSEHGRIQVAMEVFAAASTMRVYSGIWNMDGVPTPAGMHGFPVPPLRARDPRELGSGLCSTVKAKAKDKMPAQAWPVLLPILAFSYPSPVAAGFRVLRSGLDYETNRLAGMHRVVARSLHAATS